MPAMTKPHRQSLSPKAIEDLLRAAPRSNEDLRLLTGYSRCGVRNQLERMESAGMIHRERREIPRAAGYCYIWHFGPGQSGLPRKAASVDEPKESSFPGAVPKQRTVRQYAPINRRDYLVAALFGVGGSAK